MLVACAFHRAQTLITLEASKPLMPNKARDAGDPPAAINPEMVVICAIESYSA
jgi:hypothetical protein